MASREAGRQEAMEELAREQETVLEGVWFNGVEKTD
jgi:hypothetical protein